MEGRLVREGRTERKRARERKPSFFLFPRFPSRVLFREGGESECFSEGIPKGVKVSRTTVMILRIVPSFRGSFLRLAPFAPMHIRFARAECSSRNDNLILPRPVHLGDDGIS